jgi:hypothetical protein
MLAIGCEDKLQQYAVPSKLRSQVVVWLDQVFIRLWWWSHSAIERCQSDDEVWGKAVWHYL